MKSGLKDRNNETWYAMNSLVRSVSMKSGLKDRNNDPVRLVNTLYPTVSMKSGLKDRNNLGKTILKDPIIRSQ